MSVVNLFTITVPSEKTGKRGNLLRGGSRIRGRSMQKRLGLLERTANSLTSCYVRRGCSPPRAITRHAREMGLTASARNIYRYNVVDGGVGITRISALNQLPDVYLIILIASEKKTKEYSRLSGLEMKMEWKNCRTIFVKFTESAPG